MDLHVLLVDDDESLAQAIARQLRNAPYRLRSARSGDEAIAAMARDPADVLVSDECMPGMSGVELLGEVASRWPATVALLLTGQATAGTLVQALNRGHILRCLLKPCSAVDLDAAIRSALAWKLSRDRADALLPLFRRQREMLAEADRLHPGLLVRLEASRALTPRVQP